MRSHADFFRARMNSALGAEPVSPTKLSEWANSHSANLVTPTAAGYPQALRSLSSLRPLYSHEAVRFASAALESYATSRARWAGPEDREGMAWRLVSLYYAAYYAAHSILRLSGISVTQVDSWKSLESEFDSLYKSVSIPALGLNAGYHVFQLDPGGSTVQVTKANVNSKHGSHSAVWDEFKSLADSCYANNALNTTQHKAAIAVYLKKLCSSVSIDGNTIKWPWLSSYRNYINYRLPESLWGPLSKRVTPSNCKHVHRLIFEPTDALVTTSASASETVHRLTGLCVYVLTLLAHLLKDIELRARYKNLLPHLYKERAELISKLCVA